MLDSNQYLLSYLKECGEGSSLVQHIDMLKLELDWHIYHYGNHFSNPLEGRSESTSLYNQLKKVYRYLKSSSPNVLSTDKINILSLVYFNQFNTLMEEGTGFNLVSPYWGPVGNKVIGNPAIRKSVDLINKSLSTQPFSFLISPGFQDIVATFNEQVYQFTMDNNLRALFLYTDQLFYSKSALQAFEKVGRPSAILSHGLPGIYHEDCDSRSDYLMVWGPAIRDNYIKAGFSPSKILVLGHPSYNPETDTSDLRFDFSNILVLPKSTSPHQHSFDPILSDRGNLIIYLLMIKKVLMKLGVKKARLRAHPTMSKEWLLLYLGDDFFELDYLPLHNSLSQSSLVIGPTSTLLLEALLNKVNYMVYEPVDIVGKDLTGYYVVPPFDGSDPYVPVAGTEEELFEMLNHRERVNPALLQDYLTPFDKSVIKKIIK